MDATCVPEIYATVLFENFVRLIDSSHLVAMPSDPAQSPTEINSRHEKRPPARPYLQEERSMFESIVSKLTNFIHTAVRAIAALGRPALWLTVAAILAVFLV